MPTYGLPFINFRIGSCPPPDAIRSCNFLEADPELHSLISWFRVIYMGLKKGQEITLLTKYKVNEK